LIVELSKDDNQDVRQGALQATTKCGQHLGTDIVNSILPIFKSGT
jgi:hypothetical protein